MIPEGNPISKFRYKATYYFTTDADKYQALLAKTRNKKQHKVETITIMLACTYTNARNRTSIQKGLRDRNSPTCTLSQNGYGDCWAQLQDPTHHQPLWAIVQGLQQPARLVFPLVFPNEYSLRHPNYSYPQSLPSTLLYIGFSLAMYKEALLSEETYKVLQLTNIVTWMHGRCPSMQWVVGVLTKKLTTYCS